MNDETIVSFVNTCICLMNADFEMDHRALVDELRIRIRFRSVPTEFNLGPLLLQIHPPENDGRFADISSQILKELIDQNEAKLTGDFDDVRNISILFTVETKTM